MKWTSNNGRKALSEFEFVRQVRQLFIWLKKSRVVSKFLSVKGRFLKGVYFTKVRFF